MGNSDRKQGGLQGLNKWCVGVRDHKLNLGARVTDVHIHDPENIQLAHGMCKGLLPPGGVHENEVPLHLVAP